jgi:toxin-antitoxin system PIN domain toxin
LTIIDANILLNAYDAESPHQPAASLWLSKLLESGEAIGLPWISIWAFIRISTNHRIVRNPKPASECFAIVREWLAQPGVFPLNPGPLHAEILEKLAAEYGVTGPLLTDAALAALALEYGGKVASADQDFRRFPSVKWINPLGG